MHISFNQIFSNLQFQAVKNKVLQTLTHASVQQKVIVAVTTVFTLALVTFAVVRCLRNRKASILPTNKIVVTGEKGKIIELKNLKEVKADDEIESESKVKSESKVTTEVPVSRKEQLKKEREEGKAARAKAEAEKVNSMAIIVHPNFPLTQAPKVEVNKNVAAHMQVLKDAFVRSLLSPLKPALFVPPVAAPVAPLAPAVQAAPQAKVEAPLNDAVETKLEEKNAAVEEKVEPQLVVEEPIAPATPVRWNVFRKEELSGLPFIVQQMKISAMLKENCRLFLNAEKAEKNANLKKGQVQVQPQPEKQGFLSRLFFGARVIPV